MAPESIAIHGGGIALGVAGDETSRGVDGALKKASPVLGNGARPRILGDERRDRGILLGRNIDVIRYPGDQAQIRRAAQGRDQKPGFAFNGRIGVGKIGKIAHGNTVNLQPGIAVFNDLIFLVVNDFHRLDLP